MGNNSSGEFRTSGAPKVLLADTSHWALGARLAISLSRAGAEVSAICPAHSHPLRKTRAIHKISTYSGVHPIDSLAQAIAASDPDVVVPCDDRATQHLHELYGRELARSGRQSPLCALIERSVGAPESFPVVSSRYDLLKVAREEGLRVPDTETIAGADDLQHWRDGHPLPCVLKADGTWGGGGVKIARTRKQVDDFFYELTRLFGVRRALKRLLVDRESFCLHAWWEGSEPSVVAQAQIDGRPANCAVICWQGKVLAGIAVEVVSAAGQTGPASVVRVVDSPEMLRFAERLAARLNLSGFFGLDFMIEYGSGAAYLIEMNPRCTPLCHLQLGTGRDMAVALCAQLTGQPMPETRPDTDSELVAYFPHAALSKSPFLKASFEDVPVGEPELIQELLAPWPERSAFYRIIKGLQKAGKLVMGSPALADEAPAVSVFPPFAMPESAGPGEGHSGIAAGHHLQETPADLGATRSLPMPHLRRLGLVIAVFGLAAAGFVLGVGRKPHVTFAPHRDLRNHTAATPLR